LWSNSGGLRGGVCHHAHQKTRWRSTEWLYRHRTLEGRACYGRRKSTVEAVFGQIKQVLGFRQFMLRCFERICGEWTLVATAYNLQAAVPVEACCVRRFGLCA